MRELQWKQAVTTFSQQSRPPLDSGMTWSRVSVGRLNCWPQYMHSWASRAKRAWLVRFGVGSIARERAWPRAAMIGCRSMPLCRPLKRLVPPWMCRQGSPSVQATASRA